MAEMPAMGSGRSRICDQRMVPIRDVSRTQKSYQPILLKVGEEGCRARRRRSRRSALGKRGHLPDGRRERPGASVDELFAGRRDRPMLGLPRQGRGAREVGELVGRREAGVVAQAMAQICVGDADSCNFLKMRWIEVGWSRRPNRGSQNERNGGFSRDCSVRPASIGHQAFLQLCVSLPVSITGGWSFGARSEQDAAFMLQSMRIQYIVGRIT
jgi:hypothetical protein